jgi:hypothetical protein
MLQRLKQAFDGVASGVPVENLPDVDEHSTPSDILMAAEVLRATLLAFLSPEEIGERRAAIGFHTPQST